MSLTSWALVMAHHRVPDNVRAGYVYLVMASFGTLALLLAFGLLAGPDGGYAFAQMRAAHPSAMIGALVLILALIGAGSKAGMVPLHVWLPLAHPAAPSHVSALMSGVMTKVAVYGFVRIAVRLAGPPAWWWSMVVLALGGITAVMGVLYALMQHDLKRLLAYHTVENIGIIFIGLGLALAFKAHGMLFAAALALTAALAARVQSFAVQEPVVLRLGRRAGRDRRARHGASRRAHPPHAADGVRVSGRLRGDLGAAAVQRLRLRVADLSGDPAQPATAVVGPEVPGARGRRAARALGGARRRLFRQGLRRDVSRPPAHAAPPRTRAETDSFSLAAMFVLAALCLVAGILPGLFIDALAPVVDSAGRRPHAGADRLEWLSIVPIARKPQLLQRPAGLRVHRHVAASLAAFAIHRLASDRLRRAPAWDCGYPDPSPATQYTRDELRPADPPRVRHRGLSRPRAGRDAAARRYARRRASRRAARPDLGLALCAGRRRRRLRRRPAQPPAVPDHPPVISRLVFCALVILLLVLAIWP